tara:strand:+ start:128 stop:1051 length:924 start_codon:yes stop_codon:yes gene_type:complete
MSELRVVFLGTSSGKPTLARNVPAVALFIDGTLVLFDCGEGTQNQFVRARLRPGRVALVCLTHFHGDHVNGLPGFLSTLALNQHDKPVVALGPSGMCDYFSSLRRLQIFVPRYPLKVKEIETPGLCFEHDLFTLEAGQLDHRIETWGFRFEERSRPGRFDLEEAKRLGVPSGPLYGELQKGRPVRLENGTVVEPGAVLGEARPGRSVAYITDTRPCEGAVHLAQNVDLLIHEGTYGPEMEQEAHKRGHCTVVDAATLAKKAGVGRLVITHISSKYRDIRPLLKAARQIFPDTIIARDLDEVNIPLSE